MILERNTLLLDPSNFKLFELYFLLLLHVFSIMKRLNPEEGGGFGVLFLEY